MNKFQVPNWAAHKYRFAPKSRGWQHICMSLIRNVNLYKGSLENVYTHLTSPKNYSRQLAGVIEIEPLVPLKDQLEAGDHFRCKMVRFGLAQEVHIQIEEVVPNRKFSYRQTQGLFLSWNHLLEFENHGNNSTKVIETIRYQVPFGLIGHFVNDIWLKADLRSLLDKRSQAITEFFESKSLKSQMT